MSHGDRDVYVSSRWAPDPAQMDAYLTREVELARGNVLLLRARSKGTGLSALVSVSDTLHTPRTFLLATGSVK